MLKILRGIHPKRRKMGDCGPDGDSMFHPSQLFQRFGLLKGRGRHFYHLFQDFSTVGIEPDIRIKLNFCGLLFSTGASIQSINV